MTLRRYRRIRRLALVMAALPLIQLSACQTGLGQVAGNTLNLFPATFYNAAQEVFLLPAEIGLAIATGGFGSSGGVGGGGIGGGGLGGSGLGSGGSGI